MFVPVEELNKALNEYTLQKQTVVNRNDDIEINEKTKAYREKLVAEYAAKKQTEIHELDITIKAVERLKEKAQAINVVKEA